MVTTIEYAQMSGRAYQTTRAPINQFPPLSGWLEFFHVPDTTSTFPTSAGFEAVAFKRATGTEIVISYAGTDPGDITGDIAADLALAAGLLSDQLKQAAQYYLQVKAANPGGTISFTGHSLGGGLASLMAVMFGETAATFDQAPFLQSARTFSTTDPVTGITTATSVAINLRAYLVGSGVSVPQLARLDAFITASNPANASPIAADTLAARGGQVTNINTLLDFATDLVAASACYTLATGRFSCKFERSKRLNRRFHNLLACPVGMAAKAVSLSGARSAV